MVDRLSFAAFSVFARLIRLLPLRTALAVGAGIGRLLWIVVGRRRRIMLANLGRAFPEKSEDERKAIAVASLENLGRTFVEIARLADTTEAEMRERIRFDHSERLERYRAAGIGPLALSAHFGNFEYIAAGANTLGLIPSELIGRKIKNRYFDEWLKSNRLAHKVGTIPNKKSMGLIVEKLKQGIGIGVVLDQNMKRKVGIFVDFFGHPASTTPGLALLAQKSGAPVIPVFAVRESSLRPGGDPARHVIFIGEEIPWQDAPDEAERIRVNTQNYTRIIEDWVRRYPDQWFWLHDRWRTQPLPEDAAPPATAAAGGAAEAGGAADGRGAG
jgi:KDO2-lipid IV(A) lauroyltransferase